MQEAQQDRQEHAQPDPYGIDVEVLADAGAYAAQLGILRVAVQTARDTRLFGGFFVRILLGDVLDRAHLVDDIQDQGFLDHAGVVLRGEDQFGDAGFDVSDDLGPVGRILVGLFQAVEIFLQLLVGIGVHGERYARYAAFFNLFHSCAVGELFPAYAASARFADAGLAVARVTDRTAARSGRRGVCPCS